MEQKSKHRHFVAVPAFALFFLALSALHVAMPVQAELFGLRTHSQLIESTSESVSVKLPSETSLTLDANSKVSVENEGALLSLLHGGVRIESPGFTRVLLGTYEVLLLASRTYILKDDTSLTVIPIVESVVVTGNGERFLVLPGMQLHIDSEGFSEIVPVPESWFSQYSGLGSVQFARGAQSNFALTSTTDGYTSFLKQAQSVSTDLTLLASLVLLPQIPIDDAESQLALKTALFHADKSEDAVRAIPQMLLRSPFQISEAIFSDWSQSAIRFSVKNPIESAVLLKSISRLPDRLSDAGYPKQSKLWNDALRSVVDVTSSLLPDEEKRNLREAFEKSDEFSLPSVSLVSEKKSMPPSEKKLSKDTLLSMTRNMLLKHEVMLGSETKIFLNLEDDTSVRIENIFVAHGGSDVRYDCLYTPETDTLSEIKREGVSLPNSLSPAQFFQ